MKTRLDRNKPFGEIFGAHPTHPTAKYTQNGLLFTGDGQVILNEDEKRELAAKMRAELAELEGDTGTTPAPVAPTEPAPVATPAPSAPVAETQPLPTLPEEPALTPQQKAAATRAANKAAKLGTGALPPLPE